MSRNVANVNPPSESALTVCCIARDERDLLPQMIESVKDIADEIIVLDSGSFDDTSLIAKKHGARVERTTASEDFSSLRNKVLLSVRTPWVLMLDADERLHPDCYLTLRTILASGNSAYTCTIWHQMDHQFGRVAFPSPSVRLFRTNKQIYYYGEVCESINMSLKKLSIVPQTHEEIHIYNVGTLNTNSDRRIRMRPIFQRALKTDSTNIHLNLNLGLIYYLEGDFASSDSYFQKVLRSDHVNALSELRCAVLSLIAQNQIRAHNFISARSHIIRALQFSGNNALPHIMKIELETSNNNFDEAANLLRDLLNFGSSHRFQMHREQIFTAIVASHIKNKNFDMALIAAKTAYEAPSYESMMLGGMLSEQRSNYEEALKFYYMAKECAPDSARVKERITLCTKKLLEKSL